MNKKLADIITKDMIEKRAKESYEVLCREIAEDVAKNYTKITGVDINDLFTKADNKVDGKIFTWIENVNAEIFDEQLPKIYEWIKQKYKLGKKDYEHMLHDSNFVDLIAEELIHMVDIDKVKYEEE